MSFTDDLYLWLKDSLSENIPEDVIAFSLNLFELSSNHYGIELVGTGSFDSEDPDWACDEIWEPKQRKIIIPQSFSGQSWETCLGKAKESIAEILDANDDIKKIFQKKSGLGIGFVDGDLYLIDIT